MDIDQIIGPSWIMENMGPNLYVVDATMPAGTTKAQFQLMMQNLLLERFHLHRRPIRTMPLKMRRWRSCPCEQGGPCLPVAAPENPMHPTPGQSRLGESKKEKP